MAEVRVGGFEFVSDADGWTVYEIAVAGEKAKEPGKEIRRNPKYYRRLDVALRETLDRAARQSTGTSYDELTTFLKGITELYRERFTEDIWLVANRNDKQIRANADRVERILIEHDSRLREVESSADTEE